MRWHHRRPMSQQNEQSRTLIDVSEKKKRKNKCLISSYYKRNRSIGFSDAKQNRTVSTKSNL